MKRAFLLIFSVLFSLCLMARPGFTQSSSPSPFFDLRNQPSAAGTPADSQDTTADTESDTAEPPAETPRQTPERESSDTTPEPNDSEDTKTTVDPVTNQAEESENPPSTTGPGGQNKRDTDQGETERETGTASKGESADSSRRALRSVRSRETILPLMDSGPLPVDTFAVHSGSLPDTAGTVVRSSRLDSPTTGVAAARATGTPAGGWLSFTDKNIYLIAALMLGAVGFSALAYLFQRPRVRVIKTANRTANKYLNRSRSKKRESVKNTSEAPPPVNRQNSQGNTGSSNGEPGSRHPNGAGFDHPPWEQSDEQLRERGVDPGYRPIFKMYYQEDLTVDQIAERTEHGPGEIGLALDLLKRTEPRLG